MPNLRAVAVAFGVIFSFALAASFGRADSLHTEKLLGSVNAIDNMSLHLPDVSRVEEHSALFTGIQSHNGKHLGFSVAAVRQGPKLGIVKPNAPTVTQSGTHNYAFIRNRVDCCWSRYSSREKAVEVSFWKTKLLSPSKKEVRHVSTTTLFASLSVSL
jgi:hypothetical protein